MEKSEPDNVLIPVGEGAVRVDLWAASGRWVIPPDTQADFQIFQYPDHLIVAALRASEHYIGAGDGPVWRKIVATVSTPIKRPSLVGRGLAAMFGAAKSLVPTLGAIKELLPILLLAVLVAWQIWGRPGPGPTPPPNPPGPVDPIPSSLQAAMQTAFDHDGDANKSVNVAKFADLLESIVPAAKNSGKIKTAGDFVALAHTSTDNLIGPTAIRQVRTATGNYLAGVLPTNPATPFDDAFTMLADKHHKLAASALRGVK